MRVLVVNDSRVSTLALQNMIGKLGHEIVGVALNGTEAVEKYGELRPDVVTLDFVLPDIDGQEVAKRIRATSPNARIIMITADEVSPALRDELKALTYIRKPITRSKMLEAFEQL